MEPPKKKRRLDPTFLEQKMEVDEEDSSQEEGAIAMNELVDVAMGASEPMNKAAPKVRYCPKQVGMEGINCYDGKHANLIFENQRQAEIAYAALKHRVVRAKKLSVQFHTPLFHRRMLGEVDGEKFRIMVIGPDLPIHISKKIIDMKCSAYGVVEKIYVKKNTDKKTQSAFVIFEHHDEAARAISAVHEREIMGSIWRASFCMDNQGDAKSKGKKAMTGGQERQRKSSRGQNKSSGSRSSNTGGKQKKNSSPRSVNRQRQSRSNFILPLIQYSSNQTKFKQPSQQGWGPHPQHHPYQDAHPNFNQGRQRQSHQGQRAHSLQRAHSMGPSQRPQKGRRMGQY